SATALRGAEEPEPAPEVLVLLLLRDTGAARARGARQGLALLPPLSAGREPSLHAGGAGAVRRGVVAAGSGGRDDRLLPRLGQGIAEGGEGGHPPHLGADSRHLGPARRVPRL